jgi:hypothetical protein
LKNKILTQTFAKILIFKAEDNVSVGKLKKKNKNIFFASLKPLKKGVGSGSGSSSQRFEYGDPDTHQNVTDP